jgi:hypothetical protein
LAAMARELRRMDSSVVPQSAFRKVEQERNTLTNALPKLRAFFAFLVRSAASHAQSNAARLPSEAVMDLVNTAEAG